MIKTMEENTQFEEDVACLTVRKRNGKAVNFIDLSNKAHLPLTVLFLNKEYLLNCTKNDKLILTK
ncbi:MAG: hypothetical protein B6I31_03235 [Desulfobacteraceae bacterium 4572_19]|nr:MAG: hypothetical protein B6I31_03235 [Desulfobacteraceae bacterium 4572_19]